MSLKKILLDVVTDERRAEIERGLEAIGGPRHLKQLDSQELLMRLRAREVSEVATAFCVPAQGKREAIIEALLCAEAYRDSGSEPALYDDGPFVALFVEVAHGPAGQRHAYRVQALSVEGRSLSTPCNFSVRPPAEGPWKVRRKPLFEEDLTTAMPPREVRSHLEPLWNGARFVAIHHAKKAAAALQSADLRLPAIPLQDSLILSRRVFGDHRASLAASCKAAGVDEEKEPVINVARIVLAAQRRVRGR